MNQGTRERGTRGKYHREDIQQLRGIAVIGVIFFHTNQNLFPSGYLGVDVFFVISGYVVAPLLLDVFQPSTFHEVFPKLASFYQRRFWRLIPTLGFVLGASALLIFLFGSPSEHWRIAHQGLYSLFFIGNLGALKYSGNYFSPTPNPFIHTWSLSVEEQFYFGIPIIFLIAFCLTNHSGRIIKYTSYLLILISFIFFVSPGFLFKLFSQLGFTSGHDFAFYSPLTRCWQFLVGFSCFVISSERQKIRALYKLKFPSFISICVLLFTNLKINIQISSFVVTLVTAIALYSEMPSIRFRTMAKSLAYFGDRSYSLYLVHMPLLFLASNSPILNTSSGIFRFINKILAVILTVIFSQIIYSTIEKYSRSLGKSTIPQKSKKALLIVVTLLIPGILLTAMNYGAREGYWGLVTKLQVPPYPGFLDSKCQRDSETGPPCIYGSSNALSTVLLVGDSHAGHYSEAIISASRSENWKTVIWVKNSCPFVLGKDHSKSIKESCLNRNMDILKWIKVHHPEAVLVSQYVHRESNLFDLKRSLLELKAIAPMVGLIENNPVFPDQKDFMIQKPIFMKTYIPPKRYGINKMLFEDVSSSKQLTSWAERSGMYALRTWPLFCSNKFCTRFDKNGWLYFDNNHLSVAGASRIIPLFRGFLTQNLKSHKSGQ